MNQTSSSWWLDVAAVVATTVLVVLGERPTVVEQLQCVVGVAATVNLVVVVVVGVAVEAPVIAAVVVAAAVATGEAVPTSWILEQDLLVAIVDDQERPLAAAAFVVAAAVAVGASRKETVLPRDDRKGRAFPMLILHPWRRVPNPRQSRQKRTCTCPRIFAIHRWGLETGEKTGVLLLQQRRRHGVGIVGVVGS